ncbi:MAG: hypothetical protein HDT43_05470 [Ruminococcaceae bacterium]|nr:hypothetical protein [Oscillospiraceae bacterium]
MEMIRSFLYNVVPFRLFFCGAVLLAVGIMKRVHGAKGLAMLITGAAVLFPSVIICGGRAVQEIKIQAENYNNLYFQLENGRAGDLERVLKYGADVEDAGLPWQRPARDGERTLLGIVADNSIVMAHGTEKAAVLIEYGADVNRVMCHRCKYGHPNGEHERLCSATPVLIAADNPNYSLLKLLIDSGGDVNATDHDGLTALDIVEENLNACRPQWADEFERMKKLLIDNGAKNGKKGA